MGRSKGRAGGCKPDKKAPLIWAAEGNSFRIEQEAAGLTDDNIHMWVAAWEEALDKELPQRIVTQEDALVCSFADFSHNSLGDRGIEKLVQALLRRAIPVQVLRFFKNGAGDRAAKALSELLVSLPGPVQELHVSHNHLTSRGALSLLLASASVCPPSDLVPPLWLRLENNWIDWDPVLHELESQQVRWGASETRQSYKGTTASTQGGGRRKKSALSSVDGPARVLVHRSYRHQAARLDEAAGQRASRAKEVLRKNARYDRDELLLIRSLILDVASTTGTDDSDDGYNLRCKQVSPDPSSSPGSPELKSVALSAPPPGLKPPGLELPAAEPAAERVKLSLEQYLLAESPRADVMSDFSMSAQAAEFVPGTPTRAEGVRSWNPMAAEFTPSAKNGASDEDFLLSTPEGRGLQATTPFSSPLDSLYYSGEYEAAVAAAALDPTSPLHHYRGMLEGFCFGEEVVVGSEAEELLGAAAALLAAQVLAPAPVSLFEALCHEEAMPQPVLNPLAAEFRPNAACGFGDAQAAASIRAEGSKRQDVKRVAGSSESTSVGADEDIMAEDGYHGHERHEEERPNCAQS